MSDRSADNQSLVESRGHHLEYRLLGEGGDRAQLVFLHEGLGSIDLWREFPDQVVRTTGRLGLVYSRYGHGWSDPLVGPRTPRFMHEEALEVLPGIVERTATDAPLLIGHSDGASIALIYAGAGNPVSGLVLIAPHVMVEDMGVEYLASQARTYDETDLSQRMTKYHADPDATFRGWSDVWLSDAFRSWNIEELLPSINCPVLLIQCRGDRYGTLIHLDMIEDAVSGRTQRLVLEGDSHSPHLSHSEDVVRATAEFIEKLEEG